MMTNDDEVLEGKKLTHGWDWIYAQPWFMAKTNILISLESGTRMSDLYIVPDAGFIGQLFLKLFSQ